MPNQLNPRFETMFSLCNCPWGEEQKEITISQLEKFGIEGKEFYNRFFRPVEQYYQIFTKNMVSSPGADFLNDMDTMVLTICIGAFAEHPEWFDSLQNVPEETVCAYVEKMLISELEEEYTDIVAALDDTKELSDTTKWQLLVFQRKAKHYLLSIAEAVAQNIPAYEKAVLKVEGELGLLMENFTQSVEMSEKGGLLRLPEQMNSDVNIIPTLAFPMAVLIINDICFYGLLSDKVSVGADAELTKGELLMGAKALSEKSKVEILLCLKDGSRYNLEIAELMNLTPATVSHHMNVLLATGFVEVERRNGKMYYKLAEEEIKRYLAGVNQILLS